MPLAVINASTVGSHGRFSRRLQHCRQVHRDFAPAWNVDADLAVVAPGGSPPTGAWWIVIMDNSDLGSALGYHDLTSQGLPLGKVFVETSQRTGQKWTVLLSHEILEMLSDPFICLTALAPSLFGTYLYAYENCDACQSENFGYMIGDQLVSDFCLPAWFDANQFGGGGPFDFKHYIKQPFELLAGGYAMCRNPSTGAMEPVAAALLRLHIIRAPGRKQARTPQDRISELAEERGQDWKRLCRVHLIGPRI